MPSRRLVVAVLLCSSCTSYDFQPVTPFTFWSKRINVVPPAKLDKPDLFLVVDKSGSMGFGVDPVCNCPSGGCAPGCATRWTELQSAMGTFLGQQGAEAHLGMVPFPSDPVCSGAVTSDISRFGVDLNASADTDVTAMQQTADAIIARVNAITPSGGTPTSASLEALLTYGPLVQDPNLTRPKFALLLTDGVPNCNPANDPQLNTCACTFANPPGTPCSLSGTNQCLDDTGSVASIQKLIAAGVKTIVLGFGAETNTGPGPQTLQRLAAAGGFQRTCLVDSDCGAADTCSVTTVDACQRPARACGRQFFQAGNAAELGQALNQIRTGIICDPQCVYNVTEPPIGAGPVYFSVRYDGAILPENQPDTWRYDSAARQIIFQGASCDRILASTQSTPVEIVLSMSQEI